MTMASRSSLLASAFIAAAVLAGCAKQPVEDVLATACPPVQIAVPADRLGHRNEQGTLRFVAAMDELISSCRQDEDDLEVEIAFTLRAERGPGLKNDLVPLTYFLATVDPTREIVDKQILNVEFDLGQDKALSALRETVTLRLPASKEASGANYSLYLGFQPDQQPVQKDAKTAQSAPKKTEALERTAAGAAPKKPASSATERAAGTQTAAVGESRNPSPRDGSVRRNGSDVIEIVFALNSSALPAGADGELRAFIEALDKSRSHVLRILTSVDSKARVAGASADETERYNVWLAGRRTNRIQDWLESNGSGLRFTLEPALIQNDRSRRVRIETNPLG